MTALPRSTYLEQTSWRSVPRDEPSVPRAYGLDRDGIERYDGDPLLVALTLPRRTDPAGLLALDWADRQEALADLARDGRLWDTYGADPAVYAATEARLEALGGTILDRADGRIASPATRTIWVQLDADAFEAAFGRRLRVFSGEEGDLVFWNGPLRTNGFEADGLFVSNVYAGPATARNLGGDRSVALADPLGLGNALAFEGDQVELYPNAIAALYDFPLAGGGANGTLGLLQPGIGSALPGGSFDHRLARYLENAGVEGAPAIYTRNRRFQEYDADDGGERSLDVSVAAAVNPDATIGLYVGASETSVFSAWYDAIWDRRQDPDVVSSSYSDLAVPAPGSPLARAYDELFVDAVLANRTALIASGDGGSGNLTGNGLANVTFDSSPFTLQVGGTSLSTRAAAGADGSLANVLGAALAGDRAVLWQLIAGGLDEPPRRMDDGALFVETAWNQYRLYEDFEGTGRDGVIFTANLSTAGGVQTRFEAPDYQTGLGLSPEAVGPRGGPGRALPDVTANAGGNLFYRVLPPDLRGEGAAGGTSAAAPLWASLTLQLNAVFDAAGLPRLGYHNDLLYQAAALAPAAFNDVGLGDNVSSFGAGERYLLLEEGEDGPVWDGRSTLDATGLGYRAGEGFDLVSGLGSPNGAILTETLLAAATAGVFFDPEPVVERAGRRVESGADQTVLVQTRYAETTRGSLLVDGEREKMGSPGHEAFAFTDRLARQILEQDFSPRLVRAFNKEAQGRVRESELVAGDRVVLTSGGERFELDRVAATADFGFAAFDHPDGAGEVVIARPVAVATTPEAASDTTASVSVRQVHTKKMRLQFYEVDDFTGAIGRHDPGEAGYDRAAARRAYETTDGDRWIDGPGHGRFAEVDLAGIDAGDILAMRLRANGETRYGFAEAGDGMVRLWSYGLNVWGWEIGGPGGDRDYNDLVVGLDFGASVTDDLFA